MSTATPDNEASIGSFKIDDARVKLKSIYPKLED